MEKVGGKRLYSPKVLAPYKNHPPFPIFILYIYLSQSINIMNKYNAKKTAYKDPNSGEEIIFDSKKEMERYLDLSSNEHVTNLQRQVEYELIPKNNLYRAVKYIADFVYTSGGTTIVEDVKGMVLPEFRLKSKLFYNRYGIPISIYPPKKPKSKHKK